MVTNYPQQLTANPDVAASGAERVVQNTDGVVARVMGRLGQVLCGMRGHDSVLHFEGSRVNSFAFWHGLDEGFAGRKPLPF